MRARAYVRVCCNLQICNKVVVSCYPYLSNFLHFYTDSALLAECTVYTFGGNDLAIFFEVVILPAAVSIKLIYPAANLSSL